MRLWGKFGFAWLLAISAPALAALTPKEALRLAKHPESVMVDASTCEMRNAIYNASNGKLVGAGHHIALFRHYRDKLPFAEGITQEDSTVTLRFEAKPDEVFYGRAFQIDNKERKIINVGPMYRHVCKPSGRVDVGDLEQVKQKEAADETDNLILPDVEGPHE
jgi:hypothetical protein